MACESVAAFDYSFWAKTMSWCTIFFFFFVGFMQLITFESMTMAVYATFTALVLSFVQAPFLCKCFTCFETVEPWIVTFEAHGTRGALYWILDFLGFILYQQTDAHDNSIFLGLCVLTVDGALYIMSWLISCTSSKRESEPLMSDEPTLPPASRNVGGGEGSYSGGEVAGAVGSGAAGWIRNNPELTKKAIGAGVNFAKENPQLARDAATAAYNAASEEQRRDVAGAAVGAVAGDNPFA